MESIEGLTTNRKAALWASLKTLGFAEPTTLDSNSWKLNSNSWVRKFCQSLRRSPEPSAKPRTSLKFFVFARNQLTTCDMLKLNALRNVEVYNFGWDWRLDNEMVHTLLWPASCFINHIYTTVMRYFKSRIKSSSKSPGNALAIRINRILAKLLLTSACHEITWFVSLPLSQMQLPF